MERHSVKASARHQLSQLVTLIEVTPAQAREIYTGTDVISNLKVSI
jgi:hypothetical protein